MSYNISWSTEAEETFNKNIEYLQQHWSKHVVENFFQRTLDVIDIISSEPLLFPLHKTKGNIHRCVVTEQISLYYKIVDRSNIELQTFWNVYQNPKKLKL